jgi:UDP-N-acetylmuramyl pentapeptide phosphotransferase/UDP-N-acetylglucosamine-1-phosphate transferase
MMLNILCGYILTFIITSPVVEMVRRAGFVRPNFKGDPIPVGVGFIFLLAALLSLNVDFLLLPGLMGSGAVAFLMGIAIVTFLGLLDDTLGSREDSGLKGHFKALLKGRLTTGALKALAGGIVALTLAVQSYPIQWWQPTTMMWIVVDTLIIALSINAINLLDLRPGRACKGFILLAVMVIAIGWGNDKMLPLALLLGCVLSYMPWDLKARTMMGDTGSNALGLTIGMTAAWAFGPYPKLMYLLFLILFHVLTEKYSLTKIIASNKVLDYLDKLGRN